MTQTGINISSLILGAEAARATQVAQQIAGLPGAEVHAVGDDGRMIVTLESDSERATVDAFETIRQLPGVLSASLVYHQYETDPDEEA